MTAYDMRISDWSSDVCSSDLQSVPDLWPRQPHAILSFWSTCLRSADDHAVCSADRPDFSVTSRYGRRGGWRGQRERENFRSPNAWNGDCGLRQYRDMVAGIPVDRSEEHTSELQSLMRISYAVFCLKKKNERNTE